MKKNVSLVLAFVLSALLLVPTYGAEGEAAQPYVSEITWESFDGPQDGYLILQEDGTWQVKFSMVYGDMMLEGTYLPDGTMEYETEFPFFPMEYVTEASAPAMEAYLSGEVELAPIDPDTCAHAWWHSTCVYCGIPCEHTAWSNGLCAACGLKCKHESFDEETRLCDLCGMFIAADPADCEHVWNEEGVCTLCAMESDHPDWSMAEPYTFDLRTEDQKEYLAQDDKAIATAYSPIGDRSHPKALICDFSADEGIPEGESYLFQKASDPAFTDAVTVEGLPEKCYNLFNVLLGEHFYWRGGTSLDEIENSPVHEVFVSEEGPRTCQVEGLFNVRDIGGYASSLAEGGVIKQGLYYRGAAPDAIREIGKERFVKELGIGAELDLRDADKCTGPYVDGVDYYAAPIPSGTEATRFEEFAEEYCLIFDVISRADEKPVYLHCSAGADRTGISSFILLALLGADYDDIATDYMYTNFSGQNRGIGAMDVWWEKLQALEGETTADKAATWLLSKGVPAETIERIQQIFVEG